jgi:hypothetical protein
MQLQPNGKDLYPEPSQKMVYKIDKLAIPGIYPYDWDDLFISHKMVGFYGMFFFFF